MTTLPYRDHGYIRFISERTGETLFEIKMLGGSMLIWGAHYRPSEFKASLVDDGANVSVRGALCDRVDPVVTFGERLDISSGFRVELGQLPADYDGTWSPTTAPARA